MGLWVKNDDCWQAGEAMLKCMEGRQRKERRYGRRLVVRVWNLGGWVVGTADTMATVRTDSDRYGRNEGASCSLRNLRRT